MNKKSEDFFPPELTPPPEEFPAPAPEITPPPEEFPPPGTAVSEDGEKRRRRRLRKLGAFTAAAVLLLLLSRHLPGTVPALPLPTEPSLPVAETPLPEETPAPTPEPSPEPTPEPEPSCEILFYNFSSTNYIRLLLTVPEAFESISLELREPVLDLPVTSFFLEQKDLSAGELILPGCAVDDLYFEHMEEYNAMNRFPEELALHAVIVYVREGETITEERDLIAAPEQGWGLMYWSKNAEESDWSFPNCFRFETYESLTPIELVLDDPEAVKPGVISVAFSIDGREIDPAAIQYDTRREAYEIAGMAVGEPFYYARFLFEKPDWAPEKGTLHVTVVQYLENYRRTVVIERDLDYDEAQDWP